MRSPVIGAFTPELEDIYETLAEVSAESGEDDAAELALKYAKKVVKRFDQNGHLAGAELWYGGGVVVDTVTGLIAAVDQTGVVKGAMKLPKKIREAINRTLSVQKS